MADYVDSREELAGAISPPGMSTVIKLGRSPIVRRLKMLKRQMCGQTEFDLLGRRWLLAA
jgi:hypothetical protein